MHRLTTEYLMCEILHMYRGRRGEASHWPSKLQICCRYKVASVSVVRVDRMQLKPFTVKSTNQSDFVTYFDVLNCTARFRFDAGDATSLCWASLRDVPFCRNESNSFPSRLTEITATKLHNQESEKHHFTLPVQARPCGSAVQL